MIEIMTSPFRYNKKERKRLRRRARKWVIAAGRLEREGTKPVGAAALRRLADSSARIALAKRVMKKAEESK
jgi:hypothetical protein